MKRIVIIAAAVLVASLTVFILIDSLSKNSGEEHLYVVYDKSSFSDFNVVGGKLHINCEIVVKNTDAQAKTFKLTASMPDEAALGMLNAENVPGYAVNLTDDTFKLPGDSEFSFFVVFIADFTGPFSKADRLPPRVVITEV